MWCSKFVQKSLENVSHRVSDRDFLANRIARAFHVFHTWSVHIHAIQWRFHLNAMYSERLCTVVYLQLKGCHSSGHMNRISTMSPLFRCYCSWYMSMTMSLAVMKNHPKRTEPECESERDTHFAHVLSAIVFHRHYHFRFQYLAGGDSMHFKQQLSHRTTDQMGCLLW